MHSQLTTAPSTAVGIPASTELHPGHVPVGPLVLGAWLRTERCAGGIRLRTSAATIGRTVRDLRDIEAGMAPAAPGEIYTLLQLYGSGADQHHALTAIAHVLHDGTEPHDQLADLCQGWPSRLFQLIWQASRVRAAANCVVPLGLRSPLYGATVAEQIIGVAEDDLPLLTHPIPASRLTAQPWTVVLGEAIAIRYFLPGLDAQLDHLLHLSETGAVDLRVATGPAHPSAELLELVLPGPPVVTVVAEVTRRGVLYRAGPHGAAGELSRLIDSARAGAASPEASRILLRRSYAALAIAALAAAVS
ncbi:Scr1 family TA system antitoxin-like transcriptional regulator [Kitasatospora sp. MBT63]|uniref:Scr1 family TA system antitoxin-like transcriptional regulator n=1 Tax=Kitasatospora sp. MBT63 TaxID=1444768 RepID=UPI00053A0EE2|nr:Scr1 family TA system antitoxin-like transcriptional regulator [Kitasatospora sp. MBT63]